jgi:hypothetical protein
MNRDATICCTPFGTRVVFLLKSSFYGETRVLAGAEYPCGQRNKCFATQNVSGA